MVEIRLDTIKILDPDTGLYKPLTSIQGASVFIRYSKYADGTDFTETRSEGQDYMGVMTGLAASENKEDYVWSYTRGEAGSTFQAQIKTWEDDDI